VILNGGHMKLEDLSEIIKTRRSIRRWENRPVPEELIRQGLELATWAPNGGNFQGWYFIAVTKQSLIAQIADFMQATMSKIASWPEADAWREDADRYKNSISFFKNAPVLIAVFHKEYASLVDKILAAREDHDPDAARMRTFRKFAPSAIQSTASAITTMLLTYHAMGLGAIWMAAPLIAKEEIERLTEAPRGYHLVACVALGYREIYRRLNHEWKGFHREDIGCRSVQRENRYR
jgi:nitroreductase